MKKLTIILEQNKDGYWGKIQEYPDVFCHGSSLKDLSIDAKDALDLFIEEKNEKIIINPEFNFVVDLQNFFQINDYLNLSKLAKRTGMNASLLRQYSSGIKYPGIEQVLKIEKTINEIGVELVNTHLVNETMMTK